MFLRFLMSSSKHKMSELTIDCVNPAYKPSPDVDALFKLIEKKADFVDMVKTSIEAIREVESFTHLKGQQKLEVVRDALVYAMTLRTDISAERKKEIQHFVVHTLPPIATAVISVAKHPMTLRAIDAMDDACCNCLPPLTRKR